MPSGNLIDFGDLYERLQELFEMFMSFGSEIFKIFTFEVTFGDTTISLVGAMFGVGFIAWVLYKMLPIT